MKLNLELYSLSLGLLVQWQTFCEGAESVSRPIRATSRQIESAISRLDDARNRSDRASAEKVLTELASIGPEKIPVIMRKFKDPGTSKSMKFYLLQAIYRTPGSSASEALLQISLSETDSEISRMAGMSIGERTLEGLLSDEEFETLLSRIESNADAVAAAHWGYVLARSKHVNRSKLTEVLVRRFVKETERAERKEFPPLRDSYLSPKAWHMNNFLRVFPYLDTATALPLLKQSALSNQQPHVRDWILIARGMAGDESAAEPLKDIVENEWVDISLRALALRAYGRSRNDRAVSLLERYVADATQGPDPSGRSPLAIVASSELALIRGN